MIDVERSTGPQPYPPRFDPAKYPAGTICRVTAKHSRLTATYESTGECWRRTDVPPRATAGAGWEP